MNMFNIGDRVEFALKACLTYSGELVSGDTGTIAMVDSDSIGVIWDTFVGGHDLGGLCKEGYGWFVGYNNIISHSDSSFEPASESELEQLFKLG